MSAAADCYWGDPSRCAGELACSACSTRRVDDLCRRRPNMPRSEAEWVAPILAQLRCVAIVTWRETIERDHREYPNTQCKRCKLCGWRWQEHLGGDLRHDPSCVLYAEAG